MSAIDLLIVFAVAICLLVSFLFSGSETALTTSSRAAMMRLDTHQIYFFAGRRYLRYSKVDDGPDVERWIDKHWMPFPRG